MRIRINRQNIRNGAIIYAAGDTVAALILGQFSPLRTLGIMLIGATIYAFEIPTCFHYIDQYTKHMEIRLHHAISRTLLAFLYFNPLWIARHLLFITILNGDRSSINSGLLKAALLSWLVNIPISLTGNAIIQLKLPLRRRFVGSAIFSGLMAIYYALSGVWFNE
jgi:hypothetical protein